MTRLRSRVPVADGTRVWTFRPMDSLPPSPPAPGARTWVPLAYGGAGIAVVLLAPAHADLGLNALNLAVFAHAGVAMMRRAQREPQAAAGWRLLGAALGAQALNQAWATGAGLVRGQAPPFPSWGDALSILCLILVASGLLAFPLASTSGSERLRKGLDGLGTGVSIFFLSWFLVLGPWFHTVHSTALERVAVVAFFLGNATILGLGTYLGARQPIRFRGPLGWILLAFAASLLQTLLQIPLVLQGRYHLGHPLDLLVLASGIALLLAPHSRQALEPGSVPLEEARDRSLVALLLPILPAATALGAAFGALLLAPHRLDFPIVLMGILLAALGLLRALLALRDLQRLSSALELRVQERTRALEEAQDLLLRTERLNSMASLGAGLAHDLKNLLGIVRLNTDLLVEGLGPSAPSVLRQVGPLREAVERAAGLAENLMTVGRDQPDPTPEVELVQRLGQVASLLRATLPPAIRFHVELPSRPLYLRCQPGRLDQLVVNLVLNARDAMPRGGSLSLHVRLLQEGTPAQVELEVADTGTGIPEALHARIFEPFFTTKPPGRGTGLGLASVRQTVEGLDGTLSVSSAPDEGTTFTLRLPVRI